MMPDPNTDLHPLARLWAEGIAGPHPHHPAEGHYAAYRYGPEIPDLRGFRAAWQQFIAANLADFCRTWDRLADEESRSVLAECLVFNAIGWRRLKRRRNTDAYQALACTLPYECTRFPVIEPRLRPLRHKFINLHDIPELDLSLATSDGFFLNVIHNRQYHLERPHKRIAVEPGDVVLDCGAGWGDTSILFAREASPDGQVFAFEFVPSNLDMLRANVARNPCVAWRVNVVPNAVSHQSGDKVGYADRGTGTRMDGQGQDGSAETLSIDDFVDRYQPGHVDFIKMDIEGAEGMALAGGRDTLRAFKPKLAICAYHRHDDLYALVDLIESIEPSYRFYLDHHTIHWEETVLYADARSTGLRDLPGNNP